MFDEFIEKYVTRGWEVAVGGRLNSRSYEDSNGIKRYVTEVETIEIFLMRYKNGNPSRK